MGNGLETMGTAKGQELLTALQKQEPGWLDRPIEEVAQMVDIGKVWLKAQISILNKIGSDDVARASEFFKSRLETTRTAARGFFKGMEKIGEVRANVGEARGGDRTLGEQKKESRVLLTKKGTMAGGDDWNDDAKKCDYIYDTLTKCAKSIIEWKMCCLVEAGHPVTTEKYLNA